MIIGNVEGDELIMQTCLSVGTRKYYIEFPNGTRYNLHGRYKINGRFNRASVEKQLLKLGKDVASQCEIVLDVDYTGKEGQALYIIDRQIRKLYALTKCDLLRFYVGSGDGSNFRFTSAKTLPYKGGRKEKPPIHTIIRNYLIACHGAEEAHGYEADDMLGIYQTDDTIAIHCDKDINMIPGKHFNTMKDLHWESSELGYIDDDTGCGLAQFYLQLLTGDMTDNIPPLPKNKRQGWGRAGAVRVLGGCTTEKDYLETVVALCRDLLDSGWCDRLKEQADLVWICRDREQKGSDYLVQKLEEYSVC